MKKLLTTLSALICALCCAFGLTACVDEHKPTDEGNDGKSDTQSGEGTTEGNEQDETLTVSVEKVELNKDELTLEIDGTETLTATVTPDNATYKTVNWSVMPEGVVAVENGKVTAITAGTATITATAGGKSATCTVTVNEPIPTYEVTAKQWAQILDSATKYTIDSGFNNKVDKIDGDMFELNGTEHQIIAKIGENYYCYTEGSPEWTREIMPQEYGTAILKTYNIAKYFIDDFSAFTYEDGKYTAESIDKTADSLGICKNIVITFKNRALTGITFQMTDADNTHVINYKITNVGTSTIELPTNYIERN